ncbi:BatD family protein [Marinobacter caseinilyticus]|uniref:BatD family protein n=1 Tax=Marinobacter caseinilyticus TaxID=2692195 RepID=UPI00140DECB8|nr:BatD family protein [Marinobacter caseinilyticus]
MVSRITAVLLLFFLTLTAALAAEPLRVEPDRTTLFENESLTLTVVGEMALAINFDSLFNLGNLELPSPDIDKLEQDFEILSRHQKYNVRTVNGETRAEITWTYQLAPRRSGPLAVPALTFNDARSKPMTINVRPGDAPAVDGQPRAAFIELAADKDSVYIQEQLVLTVKLFFTGNLIRGDLSEPTHPDAVIESLGKQREYNRFRDSQRYRVVERRYAIYPQQTGELSLPPIRFDGQARDSKGKLVFLRDSAQLFEIPVKSPPAAFSGDVWLPASQLALTERGMSGVSEVAVGQSLTRTVTVTAAGLPAATLPPLELATPDSLRSYPEKPEAATKIDGDTLVGELTQTTALVGIQPGTVTLPAVRVPWWDTATDQERVAVIPERTLAITAALGTHTSPQRAEPAPVENSGQLPAPDRDSTEVTSTSAGFWPWLAGALALGWLLTLALWLRRKKRSSTSGSPGEQVNTAEKELFDALCVAARRGQSDTLDLLPRWASRCYPGQSFASTSDVVRWAGSPALKTETDHLQSRLFGANAGNAQPWDGSALIAQLRALRAHGATGTTTDPLPPLYPPELSPTPH